MPKQVKPKLDPYKTLRVKRDATHEEIRQAHRKLAMKHHPDRGGDPAKFAAVDRAWKCLGDPARRAHYDSTGDLGDAVSVEITEVMDVLVPCLFEAIQSLGRQGATPKDNDLVQHMRAGIANNKRELGEKSAANQMGMGLIREAMGRFTCTDGENLLENAMLVQLERMEAQERWFAKQLDKMQTALTWLAKYSYRFDRTVYSGSSMAAATASSIMYRLG